MDRIPLAILFLILIITYRGCISIEHEREVEGKAFYFKVTNKDVINSDYYLIHIYRLDEKKKYIKNSSGKKKVTEYEYRNVYKVGNVYKVKDKNQ